MGRRRWAAWAQIPMAIGPFTSQMQVNLDGVAHVAVATWPTDELPDNAPSVARDFVPALKGLQGCG